MSNLVTACKRCNSSKGGRLVSEWKGPALTGAQRQERYRSSHSVTASSPVTGSDVTPSPSLAPPDPPSQTLPPITPQNPPPPVSFASLTRAPDEPVAVILVPSDAERKAKASERVALIQTVVGGWNKLASDWRLPAVKDITESRQRAIIARSKDLTETYDFPEPLAGYEALFAKVRASPFLRGEKGYRVDFDFAVTTKSSFTKIMEGKYEADTRSFK